MGLRDLCHPHAHLAVRHEIVAEEDKERVSVHLVCCAVDGMSESQRLLLVDEGDRKRACCCDLFCQRILAMGMQICFELLVLCEVVLDLRLHAGVHDHDLVDSLRLECLFHDVLDDRLVDDGKELLRRALRGREEAGSEACSRNDGFHGIDLSEALFSHLHY